MSDNENDQRVREPEREVSNDRQRDRSNSREGEDGDKRDAGNTTSLLIRNISFRVRAGEIRELFSRYGDVRDVYIPEDFYSRKPRGFAFVEFYDRKDAIDAMKRLDKYDLDGRELTVVLAQDRRKSPDEMRPRRGRDTRDSHHSGRDRERGSDRGYDRYDRGNDRGNDRGYDRGYDRGSDRGNDRGSDRDRRRSRSRSRNGRRDRDRDDKYRRSPPRDYSPQNRKDSPRDSPRKNGDEHNDA